MTQVSSPRPPVVSARTLRRPCGKRSSTGPATGTSSANGSIVSSEVERDAAAGLADRHREEQRPGEGDGDEGVAGGVQRVDGEQRRQPAAVGAVGPCGRPDAPHRAGAEVARSAHGDRPHARRTSLAA